MHAATTSRLCEFARLMAKRLEANTHKDGWWTVSALGLFDMLGEEIAELREALKEASSDMTRCGRFEMSATDVKAIVREAADVANFAFMIFDQCTPPEEAEP